MVNIADLFVEGGNPDDPDCPHTETVKKFSGSELCADCSRFLSYWSGPRESYPAVQNPDGSFRLT